MIQRPILQTRQSQYKVEDSIRLFKRITLSIFIILFAPTTRFILDQSLSSTAELGLHGYFFLWISFSSVMRLSYIGIIVLCVSLVDSEFRARRFINFAFFFELLGAFLIVVSINVALMVILYGGSGVDFGINPLRYGVENAIIFVSYIFISAFTEEFSFREILPNLVFRGERNCIYSKILTSAAFALSHPYNNIGQYINIFLFGFFAMTVRDKYRSISISVGIHAGSNICTYSGLFSNIGDDYFNLLENNSSYMISLPIGLICMFVVSALPRQFINNYWKISN